MYTILKEWSSLIFAELDNKEKALDEIEALRLFHGGAFYIATEHQIKYANLYNCFDVPTRERLKNRLREFLSDNWYTREDLKDDEHLNLIKLNKWDSLYFLAFPKMSLSESTCLKKYIARLVLFSNY